MLSLADAIAASPLNKVHLTALSAAMDSINADPRFQNIHLQEPMEIAGSVSQLGLVHLPEEGVASQPQLPGPNSRLGATSRTPLRGTQPRRRWP